MNDYSFVRRNSIIIICFIALYKIKKKISVYHSIFQINFLIFLSIDFQKLHLKNMYIITFIENLNFYFLQYINKLFKYKYIYRPKIWSIGNFNTTRFLISNLIVMEENLVQLNFQNIIHLITIIKIDNSY